MDSKHLMLITLVFTVCFLSGYLHVFASMTCSHAMFSRIVGFILRGNVVGEISVKDGQQCRQVCVKIANCLSINTIKNSNGNTTCQINNNIKEKAVKQQFTKTAEGEYFELKRNGPTQTSMIEELLDPLSKPYESIGCFADSSPGAIPSLEGQYPILDGNYRYRTNAIEKCYQLAKKLGFRLFALQNGGGCQAGFAEQSFHQYGTSTACLSDGKGGAFANQVYYIKDTGINLFNQSYYWQVPIALTFQDARKHCLSKGSDLASISSEEENNFIYKTFFPPQASTETIFRLIGLNRIDSSDFQWTDGSPVTYIKWDNEQPNNYGGNQYCVALTLRSIDPIMRGRFNDNPCDMKVDFICKVKV